jgi:hypothetical protein
VAGIAAQVHQIFRVVVAIDDALAGVAGRPARRVDHGHLPRVASRVVVGDAFDHLGGREPLLEQRDGLGAVLAVGGRLGGHGAHARLGEGHRRTGPEGARLHTDAQFLRGRVERDDRERAKPRVGAGRAAGARAHRARGDQAPKRERQSASGHGGLSARNSIETVRRRSRVALLPERDYDRPRR